MTKHLDPTLKAYYVELFTTTANHMINHEIAFTNLLHSVTQEYYSLTFSLIFPFYYSCIWIPGFQKIWKKD